MTVAPCDFLREDQLRESADSQGCLTEEHRGSLLTAALDGTPSRLIRIWTPPAPDLGPTFTPLCPQFRFRSDDGISPVKRIGQGMEIVEAEKHMTQVIQPIYGDLYGQRKRLIMGVDLRVHLRTEDLAVRR